MQHNPIQKCLYCIFNSGGCDFEHRSILLFMDLYVQFKVFDALETFSKINSFYLKVVGGKLVHRNMSLEHAKSFVNFQSLLQHDDNLVSLLCPSTHSFIITCTEHLVKQSKDNVEE